MTDLGPDFPGPMGPDDDETDLTAAEHVLGLLEGQARARAAERASADPAFRARTEAWERRFASLTGEIAPVAPPADVWERIVQSIGSTSSPEAQVLPFPIRRRLIDNLAVWRTATAAMALAAASLVIVVLQPSHPPPAPASAAAEQIATLTNADGKALYIATLDPARNMMTIVPVNVVGAPDRSPEVWLIPAGGKPRPVGVLRALDAVNLPAPSAIMASATPRSVVAVSLEPKGGSPTGAPTGPVIASGQLKSV